jgi:predicted MFS family arabinose efflux permease
MAFQWMDEPAMESLLMTRVQPHERSGAAALMYLAIYAAGAVTTPVAGQAITRLSYLPVMVTAAALLVAGGVLFGALLSAPAQSVTSTPEEAAPVPGENAAESAES